jgi:hypothetical protein
MAAIACGEDGAGATAGASADTWAGDAIAAELSPDNGADAPARTDDAATDAAAEVVDKCASKPCPASTVPCSVNFCDPATGQCQPQPAPPATPCDDGEPCTAVDVCNNGKCVGACPTCACTGDSDCPDDGNACNGALYCDKSGAKPVCKINPKSAVQCPIAATGVCAANQCDPQDGQCKPMPLPDGLLCDDSDPCTALGKCQGGQCQAGKNLCTCNSDADCLQAEDGDLCNGTLYCDIAKQPPTCAVNPATVVTCATADDTACGKNTCLPKSGVCVLLATNGGKACDDGNSCTKGEVCTAGQCAGGTNTCTCKSDADCANKEDGDLCNGTRFCNLQALGKDGKPEPRCEVNPKTVVVCPNAFATRAARTSAARPAASARRSPSTAAACATTATRAPSATPASRARAWRASTRASASRTATAPRRKTATPATAPSTATRRARSRRAW